LASQLRFEGGELDELLERVRTEVGPEARIVAANRIRQGGVAGFFAREGFEVVVDIDSAAATSDDDPAGRGRAPRPRRKSRPESAPASGPRNAPAPISEPVGAPRPRPCSTSSRK